MVDAVGTVTNQSTVQKPSTSAVGATASVGATQNSTQQQFVSSSIVVDNLQNVVILEYRSSKGELVEQFPTQVQIDAFKRAERAADAAADSRSAREEGTKEKDDTQVVA